MRYLLALMLCVVNFNAYADAKKNLAPSSSVVEKPSNALADKDPMILKIGKKDVKLSQILPMLMTIIGGDLSSLSQQQLLVAIETAKKMYVMQEILSKEAEKKNYKSKPEFADKYKKSEEDTSIEILMQETGKEFSNPQLQSAYAKFATNWNRFDYKFNIIVVNDEASAKSIIAGLNSGVAFDAIAKEKSTHKSADNQKPGLVDFLREDGVVQQFGSPVLKAMRDASPGDVIKPAIKTGNGKLAVVQFISKRKASVPPMEEVKATLRMQLTNEKFAKMLEDEVRSGRVKLYSLDGKQQHVDDLFKKKAKA